MSTPKISLEQWRALVSVVESGGYGQAAEAIHKSQSTLTYAVQKMERVLGVKLFEIKGRKAALTSAGEVLYRRGRWLLDEAARLERAAATLAAGWEGELRMAVEIIFPTWLLLDCFKKFGEEHPDIRLELYESVIGGTTEQLLGGQVDFAIGPVVPQGFLGEPLMELKFVPVAHPDHPLHRLGRPLTLEDLRQHRHLVIRESGTTRSQQVSLEAPQRWTVSHKATSIRAAAMGLAWSWFGEDMIREELRDGRLKPLPMREGGERRATLYLIFADADAAGPGARRMAQIIREGVKKTCESENKAPLRTDTR
jgi:DNA-binding transcriptional LysR family regulator